MISKEHILDTAWTLFVKRGCKTVTMDEIASEAGMSKRTLYEQFGDKSQLIRDSIVMMGEKEEQKSLEIRKSSNNVLEYMLALHKYRVDARMKIYDHFFIEVKRYYPEVFSGVVSKIRETNFIRNKEVILLGQGQGLFLPDLNVDMISTVMSETVNVVIESRFGENPDFDKKEFFRNIMLVFLRGMSTPKGIKIIDDFLNYV